MKEMIVSGRICIMLSFFFTANYNLNLGYEVKFLKSIIVDKLIFLILLQESQEHECCGGHGESSCQSSFKCTGKILFFFSIAILFCCWSGWVYVSVYYSYSPQPYFLRWIDCFHGNYMCLYVLRRTACHFMKHVLKQAPYVLHVLLFVPSLFDKVISMFCSTTFPRNLCETLLAFVFQYSEVYVQLGGAFSCQLSCISNQCRWSLCFVRHVFLHVI